jgi:hypothetical protein
MYCLLIKDEQNERIVISTQHNIAKAISVFLKQVYGCNDNEINNNLIYNSAHQTWECMFSFRGSYKNMILLTA